MVHLTALGAHTARVGAVFRFTRACDEAAGCPVSRLCQSQEMGHDYRVVATRPVVHDVCTVFAGGAQVVEVEPLPVVTSMASQKLKGTKAVWQPPHCTKRGCPNWRTCFEAPVVAGRGYSVVRDLGPMTCPMGHSLHRVEVASGANA